MITPEAPAGPGYGRPTVTERSVRNAAPTQSSSSRDEGPSTFDRYTDTPCASDTACISGHARSISPLRRLCPLSMADQVSSRQ